MTLIKGSSKKGMIDTSEWLQSCNTIKLYETGSEKGSKDIELLSIGTVDEDEGFSGLLLLIERYLKGDEQVMNTLLRYKRT